MIEDEATICKPSPAIGGCTGRSGCGGKLSGCGLLHSTASRESVEHITNRFSSHSHVTPEIKSRQSRDFREYRIHTLGDNCRPTSPVLAHCPPPESPWATTRPPLAHPEPPLGHWTHPTAPISSGEIAPVREARTCSPRRVVAPAAAATDRAACAPRTPPVLPDAAAWSAAAGTRARRPAAAAGPAARLAAVVAARAAAPGGGLAAA